MCGPALLSKILRSKNARLLATKELSVLIEKGWNTSTGSLESTEPSIFERTFVETRSRRLSWNFDTLTGRGGPKSFFRVLPMSVWHGLNSRPAGVSGLRSEDCRDTSIELEAAKNRWGRHTRSRNILECRGCQTNRARSRCNRKALLTKVVRPQ